MENSQTKSPLKPFQFTVPSKDENIPDDLRLNIHIFPIDEEPTNDNQTLSNKSSVEIQTDNLEKSVSKTRNVSTQHTTRFIEKLPRSHGTLTVSPWSGDGNEGSSERNSEVSKEIKKNVKGIYTVPYSRA